MLKTKNHIELNNEQCIAVFDFMTKTKLVDKVSTTEENGLEELSPNECNEQLKIYFGRSFYEVLAKEYPSPLLDDKEAFYLFNAFIYEWPKTNETAKEIAEILLKAAPTEKEQIVLGKIIWQLIRAIKKISLERACKWEPIRTELKKESKESVGTWTTLSIIGY